MLWTSLDTIRIKLLYCWLTINRETQKLPKASMFDSTLFCLQARVTSAWTMKFPWQPFNNHTWEITKTKKQPHQVHQRTATSSTYRKKCKNYCCKAPWISWPITKISAKMTAAAILFAQSSHGEDWVELIRPKDNAAEASGWGEKWLWSVILVLKIPSYGWILVVFPWNMWKMMSWWVAKAPKAFFWASGGQWLGLGWSLELFVSCFLFWPIKHKF